MLSLRWTRHTRTRLPSDGPASPVGRVGSRSPHSSCARQTLQHAFLKAVKMAIREELDGVWKDQDDIEERLSAVELSLQFVREQLHRVEHMMQQQLGGK
jgi:hypothetical protein